MIKNIKCVYYSSTTAKSLPVFVLDRKQRKECNGM